MRNSNAPKMPTEPPMPECKPPKSDVEAIPVEWIEKWLDEFLGVKLEEEITDLDPFKKDVYQGIMLMYNDWRRGEEIEKRTI